MTVRVRDIGEFHLIERLRAVLSTEVRGEDRVGGQQDDCAFWVPSIGHRVLVTTDALVEGVHFRSDWTDWRSLGHKALAVNLSDLASMGCCPKLATITLMLTGDELVHDLEELYRGMGDLASTYSVMIVGGDVVSTPGPMTVSITAFGEQSASSLPMLRSAAKSGDVIMVSGTLGASAAGLRLLQEGRVSATASGALLVAAHTRPQPRVSLGAELHRVGVRCCMDLSDGLAGDLPKILGASGVGARIDVDAIPVLPAVRALFPDTWASLALHGGEDYELLITVRPSLVAQVQHVARGVGATLTAIGEITQGEELVYESSSGALRLDQGGWDHFPHP